MTPDEMQRVEHSWQQALPLGDKVGGAVGELFFPRLFETDPQSGDLLPGHMRAYYARRSATLAALLQGAGRLPEIRPVAVRLGRRRADYGVRSEGHSAGPAALWTLEKGAGRRAEPRGARCLGHRLRVAGRGHESGCRPGQLRGPIAP